MAVLKRRAQSSAKTERRHPRIDAAAVRKGATGRRQQSQMPHCTVSYACVQHHHRRMLRTPCCSCAPHTTANIAGNLAGPIISHDVSVRALSVPVNMLRVSAATRAYKLIGRWRGTRAQILRRRFQAMSWRPCSCTRHVVLISWCVGCRLVRWLVLRTALSRCRLMKLDDGGSCPRHRRSHIAR